MENLSKDELIDEVLDLKNFKNEINVKFSELNYCFNNFEAKYETQLEHNNLNNAQYNRRETLEINPVPSDIANDVLEQSVCQALSLKGTSVELDDLPACHRMRKLKCRKQKHRVLLNHKTSQNQSLNLTQIKFPGKLFVLLPVHQNGFK